MLGLIETGTFPLVRNSEAGPDGNIIPSRFQLMNKHPHNEEAVQRADLVLGGRLDKKKELQKNYSTHMKQSSIRFIMALSTLLGFGI